MTDPKLSTNLENYHKKFREDLVKLDMTVKLLNKLGTNNSSLSGTEIDTLSKLTQKVYDRQEMSKDEASTLLMIRDKITEQVKVLEDADKQAEVKISDLLDNYKKLVNSSRVDLESKSKAITDVKKLISSLGIKSKSMSDTGLSSVNDLIVKAKESLASIDVKVPFNRVSTKAPQLIHTSDDKSTLDGAKVDGQNFKDYFEENPSKISKGNTEIKKILSSSFSSLSSVLNKNVDGLINKLDVKLSKLTDKLTPKKDNMSESNSDTDQLKRMNHDDNLAIVTNQDQQTSILTQTNNLLESINSRIGDKRGQSAKIKDDKVDEKKKSKGLLGSLFDLVSQTKMGRSIANLGRGVLGAARSAGSMALRAAPKLLGKAAPVLAGAFAAKQAYDSGSTVMDSKADTSDRLNAASGLALQGVGGFIGGRLGGAKGAAYGAAAGDLVHQGANWVGSKLGESGIMDPMFSALESSGKMLSSLPDRTAKLLDKSVKAITNLPDSFMMISQSAKESFSSMTENSGKFFNETLLPTLGSVATSLSDSVSALFIDPLKSVGKAFGSMFDWLGELPIVGRFFKGLKSGAQAVINVGTKAVTAVKETAVKAGAAVKETATNVKGFSKEVATNAMDSVEIGRASCRERV